MLIAVLNHARTAAALALADSLNNAGRVHLIDSGSALTPAERARFDVCLPNVYYSGLLNAAAAIAQAESECTGILLWASDVSASVPEEVAQRAQQAIERHGVGVYAPSSLAGSSHRQMRPLRADGLRAVTFTDGFCFALRRELLLELCPVDTSINQLGHGLDVQLAYLAWGRGWPVVVDDGVRVEHPRGSGYSDKQANRECAAWVRRLPVRARWFHRVARLNWAKTEGGMRLVRALLTHPRR